MKIIVTTKYDYIAIKSLIEFYICSLQKDSRIIEHTENGQSAFETVGLGVSIVCNLVPEYKTVYKEVSCSKEKALLGVIETMIAEWRESI